MDKWLIPTGQKICKNNNFFNNFVSKQNRFAFFLLIYSYTMHIFGWIICFSNGTSEDESSSLDWWNMGRIKVE